MSPDQILESRKLDLVTIHCLYSDISSTTTSTLTSTAMTTKGQEVDKAVVARVNEDEEVPSYQEAIAGGSTKAQAPPLLNQTEASKSAKKSDTQAPSASSQQNALTQVNLYPFPSMPIQPGYGQSPYQIDGTTRIAIIASDGQSLPLHATGITPGPPAGKRFLTAFFWAILLYMILGAIMGTAMQMEENAHQPKTPPGWHHHHGGHKASNWSTFSIRLT